MADVALITGANSGIGLATVLELAQRGFDVVGSVRSEEKAEEVVAAGDAAGHSIRTVILDVTDRDTAKSVIDELRPAVLVNNAGLAEPGAIEDVPDEEGERQLDTLAVSPMRLARYALPHMRAAGGGRIINVSSMLASIPAPIFGWYSAAKQALEGLSDALRLEVAADGIHVVLIEPGAIRTGVFADARGTLSERAGSSSYRSAYQAWGAITRQIEPFMARPQTVANAIADAAVARSPKSRYRVGLDARLLERIDQVAPAWMSDSAARLLLRL